MPAPILMQLRNQRDSHCLTVLLDTYEIWRTKGNHASWLRLPPTVCFDSSSAFYSGKALVWLHLLPARARACGCLAFSFNQARTAASTNSPVAIQNLSQKCPMRKANRTPSSHPGNALQHTCIFSQLYKDLWQSFLGIKEKGRVFPMTLTSAQK